MTAPDDLPDNAGLHTWGCAVWTSPDPADTCDCGADEQAADGGDDA